MRVLCGGEDGVMGVYGGELLPDNHKEAENRLIRVDAIYDYPKQRAIITHNIIERLPLPYGAEVRLRVIGEDGRAGAADEEAYAAMIQAALERLIAAYRHDNDVEAYLVLKRRDSALTGISGSYCRI